MKGTSVPQGASGERNSLRCLLLSFFNLPLPSYDNNTHVECLLSANLYLVSLLSSEQCSQFGIFRVQMVNKHPVSKQLIGNNVTFPLMEMTCVLRKISISYRAN